MLVWLSNTVIEICLRCVPCLMNFIAVRNPDLTVLRSITKSIEKWTEWQSLNQVNDWLLDLLHIFMTMFWIFDSLVECIWNIIQNCWKLMFWKYPSLEFKGHDYGAGSVCSAVPGVSKFLYLWLWLIHKLKIMSENERSLENIKPLETHLCIGLE